MNLSWRIDEKNAIIILEPATTTDRAILEALGNVQIATVKKNGLLTFTMELPNQPLVKPIVERPADQVRDAR